MNYTDFLRSKTRTTKGDGLPDHLSLSPGLFPFQADCVRWALRKGKAAIFSGTGLGKTYQQLEWAQQVHLATGKDVLILAPLAVARQTVREGAKFGIRVQFTRFQDSVGPGITVTNYDCLDNFDPSHWGGIVLDESSILKAFDGKTRTKIIGAFAQTPFRLACTATPAPNDYMELGNHAQFLGVMSREEMLATFFVHDGGNTSKWRLKGHAERLFWEWVCGWAVMITKPSDLGYEDGDFALPPLHIHEHIVVVGQAFAQASGTLIASEARTLADQRKARRASLGARVEVAAALARGSTDPWLLWCDLNDESSALVKGVPGAVEVRGADKDELKEQRLSEFSNGAARVLVTKPSIAGWGMNWQHCSNMAFVGLSHSYEALFQAIRRCWRFGQRNPVHVHIITSDAEGAVLENVRRKEAEHARMVSEMAASMRDLQREQVRATTRQSLAYEAVTPMVLPRWI